MKRCTRWTLAVSTLTSLVLATGCGDDDSGSGLVCPDDSVLPAEAVPDFSLEDQNPTSTTYGNQVSPRDHLQAVSAWYFGHAT